MTDHPMLYSPPMVRALLEGRKTQTRRLLKATVPPQPEADCNPRHVQKHAAPYLDSYCGGRRTPENPRGMTSKWCWWQVDDRCCLPQFQVPYVPGDRIWVKETHWRFGHWEWWPYVPKRKKAGWVFVARPDVPPSFDEKPPGEVGERMKSSPDAWHRRSSLFLERQHSRLTLTITEVRVQRVQEISERDAIAEGIEPAPGGWWSGKEGQASPSPVGAYALLWQSLNTTRAPWADNPWVAAITFTVEQRNIDAARPEAA